MLLSLRSSPHLAGWVVLLVGHLVSGLAQAQGTNAQPVPAPPSAPVEPYAPPDPWNPRADAAGPGQSPGYPPQPPPGYPLYSPYLPNPYQSGDWRNPNAAGGVFVELRTSTPKVRIDRVLSDGGTIPVCTVPCRQVLPRNAVYVITGDGVRTTSRFVLPDDRDHVTFDVQAGSSSQLLGGALLAGGGLLVAYFGLLVAASSGFPDPSSTTSSSNNSSTRNTVGATMLVGGGLAAALGLYLTLRSHTTVSSSTGSRFTDNPRPRKRSRFALTGRGLEF